MISAKEEGVSNGYESLLACQNVLLSRRLYGGDQFNRVAAFFIACKVNDGFPIKCCVLQSI